MNRFGALLAAALLAAMPMLAKAQVPSAQPTFSVKGSQRALTLTAASASFNGNDIFDPQGRGLVCIVNLTAVSGTTPSLTLTIQGKDSLTTTSPPYYTLLASAALTTTGVTVLRVYPGLTAVANATASDIVPPIYRIITTESGTTPSFTGTVDCYHIP